MTAFLTKFVFMNWDFFVFCVIFVFIFLGKLWFATRGGTVWCMSVVSVEVSCRVCSTFGQVVDMQSCDCFCFPSVI